ncbi:hypothetical protein TIFTF001_023534 [Ficus carica]|uniref:Transcription factor GTE4 n=1 Tax=Ficus carica TaxID=3494 RepID=A0AA88AKM4_FICCA|nr:hypothetical protein TIFTF001_023534 [Ficus carica]
MASGPKPLSRKSQKKPPTERAAIDEDRSSRSSSRESFPLSGRSETANGDGGGIHGYAKLDGRVKISLNSCSKVDIRELKRRLMSELDEVRCLVKKLEASKDFHGGSHSQFSSNYVENPPVRVNSEVGSVGPPRGDSRRGLKSEEEKMKKKKMMKKTEVEMRLGQGKDKYYSQLFKSCSNLLDKLMKHKFGWVFNAPVDVKALGLHDYFTIVKHPMDLGTVKSRLNKTWYKSAMEFAKDVRLTFRNAMLYNPKGQDVHSMAEQLLKMFEEKWKGIEVEYNLKRRCEMDDDDDDDQDEGEEEEAGLELARPAMRNVRDPVVPAARTLERAESVTKPVDPKLAGVPVNVGHGGRTTTATPVSKKPRAKDPDKRDMTYEEKQRLSTSLQNLPSEKLDNVVQIIKKRNPGLFQQEDEIEVDIASVDLETLWELDRFVTNYKKSLSKNKRKVELALQSRAADTGHGIEKKKMASSEAPKRSKSDSDSDGLSGSGSDSRDSH